MKKIYVVLFLFFCSIQISSSYDMYGWGYNVFGQFGDGNYESANVTPQKCNSIDWKTVAGGMYFSVGIDIDYNIYAWGACGFCGDTLNPYWAQPNPYKISNDNDWDTVVIGLAVIAKKNDGSIWGMGPNKYGELGENNDTLLYQFTQIGTENDWRELSLGINHVLAIKNDGTLWAWGKNDAGQLGNNTTQNSGTPIQIGTDNNWKKILCGDSYSAGLKTDGTLWAWGVNKYKRYGLGLPDTILTPRQIGSENDWIDFSFADEYMVAVKSNGTLWQFGNKLLPDSKLSTLVNPEMVDNSNDWKNVYCYPESYRSNFYVFALKTDNSLWAWGNNVGFGLGLPDNRVYEQPTRVGTDNNWKSIFCGMDYTLGLKDASSSVAENIEAFSISPNPTQDRITVNFTNYHEIPNKVVLFGYTGETVMEYNPTDYKQTIDISVLPTGVYFVALQLSDRVICSSFNVIR